MDNKELVTRLQVIAANYRTTYMWGVFGSPVTESKIAEKVRQYPRRYTAAKLAKLRSYIGRGYYGFDCVGLIKGVLWGWSGRDTHPHGGARYEAAGGPTDLDANQMIARCKSVSADFSKIMPGCAVWMQGHIGVYIGDGKVVEATPSWRDGVQVSACLNIGPIAGLPGRRWTKHGKLPWVEYVQEPKPVQLPPMPKQIVPTLVDNEIVGEMQPAYILDGKTFVELRTTAEALGLKVHYVSADKPIKLRR